jgi:hypothetical protein
MRMTGKVKSKDNFIEIEPFGNTERLELDKVYDIDFKEYKSKRSIEQNKLLWKLIQSISKASDSDVMDTYIDGLEHCNAKSDIDYSQTLEQMQGKKYRAFKFLTNATLTNGTILGVYKVWFGSSKFNVSEMTQLIRYFQDLAMSYGINVEE